MIGKVLAQLYVKNLMATLRVPHPPLQCLALAYAIDYRATSTRAERMTALEVPNYAFTPMSSSTTRTSLLQVQLKVQSLHVMIQSGTRSATVSTWRPSRLWGTTPKVWVGSLNCAEHWTPKSAFHDAPAVPDPRVHWHWHGLAGRTDLGTANYNLAILE